MPRKLLIMRHAKSSWEDGGISDFGRPLNKRGRQDAPRMGRWLAQSGLCPDWLVSSPALRARETVLAVCQALGLSEDVVAWEPAIYEGGLGGLLDVVRRCPPQSRVAMLVGHNPGLEQLVRHLSGDRVPSGAGPKLMPTAAVAVLRMPQEWSDLGYAVAEFETLMRPRALKDL